MEENGEIRIDYRGECTMELTPMMERIMRQEMNLDLEMMRGTRELLPDGNTRFVFRIEDQEKGRCLVEFIRRVPKAFETWLN